jgi:leader peptidase (prepilin peptidase)/N-methyltransferase
MIDYLATTPAAFTTAVFIFSLLIGSFLNVVIYRVPIMMHRAWALEVAEFNADRKLLAKLNKEPAFNLGTPDSTCPHCGHQIRAWENIPLIGWLALRGKCSACAKAISARYPLVELTTALLSALIAWQFGWGPSTLALIPMVWVLVTLTLIDYDTQFLPDNLTLPLLWAGLLLNTQAVYVPLDGAVIGAATGYVSLWSIYWLFKLITGKDGMGYGDFKLFAAFGAWFGWMALPLIILLSSLVGAIVGIIMIVSLGRDRQLPIPFGPYLCGAALVYIFWGDAIMAWYLGSMF